MVGWVERSEPHQLEFGRFLVGLAALDPPNRVFSQDHARSFSVPARGGGGEWVGGNVFPTRLTATLSFDCPRTLT